MLTAGVDIGSVATKAVVLNGRGVLSRALMETGSRPRQSAQAALDQALAQAGLEPGRLQAVVSTGYGRRLVEFGHRAITEILACSRGARFAGGGTPVKTVIDLGGQDIKVISLDESGRTRDFLMNDKCAAGTGRFLEVLARALQVNLEDLGPLSSQARQAAAITATCTVFAESEVVSLLAQETPRENIIAGIHHSIAERIASLVRKLGLKEGVFFCGGGALNTGLVQALEQKLKVRVQVPEYPQYVIALGAAVEAQKVTAASQEAGPQEN